MKETKLKESPEEQKQKVEGSEPTAPFNLFINPSKSVDELKVAIIEYFAKNYLVVVDVRIGKNRKFGYVNFECAENIEKTLELTGLKVFSNEIKLEKKQKEGIVRKLEWQEHF